MKHKACPTCEREFTSIKDYPVVQVHRIETEISSHSGWVDPERAKEERKEKKSLLLKVTELDKVKTYLERLKGLANMSGASRVAPSELKPILIPDGYFKYSYGIATKQKLLGPNAYGELYLSLVDDKETEGVCSVQVWETGPNFGSAGGPSLSLVGTIATIHYVGQYRVRGF